MTNTASKLIRALCSMVVMLALGAGIAAIQVVAASPGIYTATATSHYRHPTTGVIEDSGGESSYVLGQSMTESALNPAALVEVDSGGNSWVTIRLNLMDNIQSPQFQVDGSRNGSFSSVSATVMQEDYTNNTTDFRMQVPSENAIIRCNMYVVPMGREVIFYITVGDLQAGSGDFVTSISVDNSKPAENSQQPAATTSSSPSGQTLTPEASSASQSSAQSAQETSSGTGEPATTSESSAGEEADAQTASAVEQEDASSTLGLEEFDAAGNEVTGSALETEGENGSSSTVLWWVIGGVAVVLVAGGCVWYFGFFRKRK